MILISRLTITGESLTRQLCILKNYVRNLREQFCAERDLIIGFGRPRKLSRIDDRKLVHIRNMDRLTIVDPRGFG